MGKKLWSGRFSGPMLPELERFASSLEMAYELYPYDVAGSLAHARGLAAARLLSKTQATAIERGLRRVKRELDEGAFKFRPTDEDIHTAIERRLTEITPAGASLHAGRSRNDQIALDLRLFCRDAAAEATVGLAALIEALASKALTHAGWLMPGYTHLQRAQPVTLGHHLLAHAEPLLRDAARFRQAYASSGEMPLGSGALAATTLPLRRDVVARELGFTRLTENSIDAVSDRDFALDLAYACAVLGIHLSRLGEDIVLWASAEFGFVTLADEISTGSSLMPQKKNPDVAELLGGRAARSLGSLVALATTLKGLPLAYDRDLQEDKTALFATVDNTLDCLEAAAILVEHLEFDRQRLAAAAGDPSMLATDAAEELVRGGTAFRKAHQEVAGQVREGTFATSFNAKSSVAGRDLVGGPNQRRVAARARVVSGVVISSVVPTLNPALVEASRRYLKCEPVMVGPGVKTSVRIRYDNPKDVGADRIANALAAYSKYGGPIVVIDFGTAVTYDAINAEGDYLGGAIAPGVEISLDALVSQTAMLRRVEPVAPDSVIGRNTVASIQSGLVWGFVAQVEGMVKRMVDELGGKARVIATGGQASLVAGLTNVIETTDPLLTLEGLSLIYAQNSDGGART